MTSPCTAKPADFGKVDSDDVALVQPSQKNFWNNWEEFETINHRLITAPDGLGLLADAVPTGQGSTRGRRTEAS
jgi:hypothetical protein